MVAALSVKELSRVQDHSILCCFHLHDVSFLTSCFLFHGHRMAAAAPGIVAVFQSRKQRGQSQKVVLWSDSLLSPPTEELSLTFFSMFPWDCDIWQSLCGKKRKLGKQTSGHVPFSKVESKKEGSWQWLLSDSEHPFFLMNFFLIYLFGAALALHCSAQALSSCDE